MRRPPTTISGEFDTIVLTILAFVIAAVLVVSGADSPADTYAVIWLTAPLWVPLMLMNMFYLLWMHYIQIDRWLKTENVLLEIRIPTEVTQSPLAMETVLNTLYHTGEPQNLIEKYWQGKIRPTFSLEIASFEGRIHFYIWGRKRNKENVISSLYSEYPTIEVHEVPDYTADFIFDYKTMNLFGVEQQKQKANPFPIKTYVDYGLDKDPKDEFKIDPMAPLLEFLGSLGKGEYCWMQIIIRSHIAEHTKHGTWFEKVDWKDEAKHEIDKVLKSLRVKEPGQIMSVYRMPTEGEKEVIASLQRSISKKPFDTGIRIIYFARNEYYIKDRHPSMPTVFRNFESHTLNGFKPKFPTNFKYPFYDPFGIRGRKERNRLFRSYRWRAYLNAPDHRPKPMVLNTEELATVFHIPGANVATPTIPRIPSKKASAPSNLPA